jgi:aryl-alcohol dehydrogenase-like predicted oxidoreductase
VTTLATRKLGTTGLQITPVGLGAWAIGGGGWAYGWGPQDDADSIRTIRHAVDCGMNWIDTAAVYGLGHSEEVLGRALREIPDSDRPLVFTKCGMVWDHTDPAEPPAKIGRSGSIRVECEASLRRLGVERIDLLQLHWPPKDGSSPEEFWGTLLALKDEGKIVAAGVSNFRLDPLKQLEAIGHIDTLQPPLSLINRQATQDLLPWCESNATGVIVYSPTQSGLLSGRWTAERVAQLPSDDWRRESPDFTVRLAQNLALAKALIPIAQRHKTTQAAIAIAWALQQRGVTGAIVGARRPNQIDEWIDAATLALTDEDLAQISEAINESNHQ